MSSQLSESLRQGLNPRQVETAERLLTAGLEELREVGHEALTIRTVAQRAGVSPATAYTYLASKEHLFAELFWRLVTRGAEPRFEPGATTNERVQQAVRTLTELIVAEPALATAVTPALLGSDVDVARLRLRIGGELLRRLEVALTGPDGPDGPDGPAEPADPAVLEALILAFSGGLLQAGMGLMTYDELADRLSSVIDVILRGN